MDSPRPAPAAAPLPDAPVDDDQGKLADGEAERRTTAIHAEQAAVKAMEEAMLARQAAEAQQATLDKANAEASAGKQRAEKTAAIAERSTEAYTAAAVAAKEANAILATAAATAKAAADVVANGSQAADAAVDQLSAVRIEEKNAHAAIISAEKTLMVANGSAADASLNLKNVKRELAAAMEAEEAAHEAVRLAQAAIVLGEKVLTDARTISEEAGKVAHGFRGELEEKQQAVETATRAYEEVQGSDTEWEAKTLEKLNQREKELKRATTQSNKANKTEQTSEAAELSAEVKLQECKDDLTTKEAKAEKSNKLHLDLKSRAERMTMDAEQTAAQVVEAETALTMAKETQQQVAAKVEAALAAIEDTRPEKAEAAVLVTQEAEAKARKIANEANLIAAAKQEAKVAAVSEKEAAAASLEMKVAAAEKAAEKGLLADTKEAVAQSLAADMAAKVQAAALAKLAVRNVWMSAEEAEEAASIAREARQAPAREARKAKRSIESSFANTTCLDKWQGWLDRQANEAWNPQRIFYSSDGMLLASVDTLISDVVGSRLDLGPIAPKQCQLFGDGLSAASLGSTASFTIIACNAAGLRFESGGASFTVNLRFTGQGSRLRAKVCCRHSQTGPLSAFRACMAAC